MSLRERLPVPPVPARPDAAAAVRRWATAHGPLGAARFTRRLAEDGLDESTLAALLAEPAEELAARLDLPPWARYVDLVEREPAELTARDAAALAGLRRGLRPFLAAVRTELTGTTRLRSRVVDRLGGRLARLAARTLVSELARERHAGRLSGATPEARFADFTEHLAGRGGLSAVLTRYPVLGRLLAQCCQQAVDTHRELLDRLADDRAAVIGELLGGRDPGPLVDAEPVGDGHHNGRCVTVLTFADGRRLVYKPRPLDLHAHFNDIVRWLDGRCAGLGLRTVRVVCRPGYGWLEFVESAPCPDAAAVSAFYHRLGALLALLYVLDGTDVHFENLIAAADQPVLVDIETLFHPRLPEPTAVYTDPAVTAMSNSVYRTALLPMMLVGQHGSLDVSGLAGGGGQLPFDTADWADVGTDTMRLVRRPTRLPAGDNQPSLRGRPVDPADYHGMLLAGFRAGYDTVAAHRDELVGPDGLLRRCAQDPVRVLVRPTQLYATLLDESTHPDVLGDALERDRLLDLLWVDAVDNPTLRPLVPHELAALWAGDVPIFFGRPGSRDLWTAEGVCLPDVLDATGIERAEAGVAAMGVLDRHRQEWLITAALSIRTHYAHHRHATPSGPITPVAPEPGRLLAAAGGLADEILGGALAVPGRLNWIGMEVVDDRQWAVLPMGGGLPSGYCGPALFLAQLAHLTGAERYAEAVRDALSPLPGLLEVLAGDAGLLAAVGSGLNGLGGICFTLARLTELGCAPGGCLHAAVELAATLHSATGAVTGTAAGDAEGIAAGSVSFLDGDAGGLAAMLAVYAGTGLPAAARLADGYAARLAGLVEDSDPRVCGGPGFATGPAGVAYALGRYATVIAAPAAPAPVTAAATVAATAAAVTAAGAAGREERFRSAARAALGMAGPLGPEAGWCTGRAGRLCAAMAVGVGDAEPWRLVAELVGRPPTEDLSLCHGELGVIDALVTAGRLGADETAQAVRGRAGAALGALRQRGPTCGTPAGVRVPGLLHGLAGIGYGLLRIGFPACTPSVLLLENDRGEE